MLRSLILCALLMVLGFAAPAHAQIQPQQNCASNDTSCNVCINESPQFSTPNEGSVLIDQIFHTINGILQQIESEFYTGVIKNTNFQNAIGIAFLMYIVMYGAMIAAGMADARAGEVVRRLIKVGIVYLMTSPNAWQSFATWIQNPVTGGINELITDMANVGANTGTCSTNGQGGTAINNNDGSGTGGGYMNLNSGPMAMLYGPMTCAMGAKLIAGIEALMTTGPFGWLLALGLIWALLEFIFMVLAALATYVKAIVGLTFLFGIAPIFFAFLLFNKTREFFSSWLSMVTTYAVQPVMVFAFLAFFCTIIGNALTNMFVDSNGNPEDICYVLWNNTPTSQIYWWRFTNSSKAAGGNWADTSGIPLAPPVSVLNLLYFLVLAHLGKGFSAYIDQVAQDITGGNGFRSVKSGEVGSWFSNKLTAGKGMADTTASLVRKTAGGVGWAAAKLMGEDDSSTGTMVARAAIAAPLAGLAAKSIWDNAIGAGSSTTTTTGATATTSRSATPASGSSVSKVGPIVLSGDRSTEGKGASTNDTQARPTLDTTAQDMSGVLGGYSGGGTPAYKTRADLLNASLSRPAQEEVKGLYGQYMELNNQNDRISNMRRDQISDRISAITGRDFDPSEYTDKA